MFIRFPDWNCHNRAIFPSFLHPNHPGLSSCCHHQALGRAEAAGKIGSRSQPPRPQFPGQTFWTGIPTNWYSGIFSDIWHSMWHMYTDMLWRSIWHSLWNSIGHTFWHSIWHPTFYLADILAFYLASTLTSSLACVRVHACSTASACDILR